MLIRLIVSMVAWFILCRICDAEDVAFETEVTFKNGTQFKSMCAQATSQRNSLKWSVSQYADAYLCRIEDISSKQVLFLWTGKDRTVHAAGRTAGDISLGLIPGDKGLIALAESKSEWKTLAEVPISTRSDSMESITADGKIEIEDNVVEGIGTVKFCGLAKIDLQLSSSSGGSVSVQVNDQSLHALFDGEDIVSLESMTGRLRNGLSLGWRKGVLLQCGVYSKEEPWEGIFVTGFKESGMTFMKKEKGEVTKRWEVPLPWK